ncbi:phage tail protein [Sphingomonas kyeonggiensis]|uniref:Microcystin-dependent protein n=1 Tax=Sphingomonas kyeonggiensis TaxID=1268553 RepID=A0A7W6JTN3_9SPHN|nr:tail fiber protein [Sphingomonas kyeonggiensis]MBB4098240.1 microcystin-dependent protein [Sphingomonas kyeonggiensis]
MGEIRLISFNFAPKGWALCNGQLLPINQNQALFSLLGTTYGGDGRVNFALPDLRGRVPIHSGDGYFLGQRDGEEAHTLSISEMPTHTHQLYASYVAGDANRANVSSVGRVLAAEAGNPYSASFAPTAVTLNPATVSSIGGSQAHENRMPFQVLVYCIALQGIFPSQN